MPPAVVMTIFFARHVAHAQPAGPADKPPRAELNVDREHSNAYHGVDESQGENACPAYPNSNATKSRRK